MVHATNFLNIPALFELCCAGLAVRFKALNFESVRTRPEFQGITRSFSEADEEELKKTYHFITDYPEDLKYEAMEGNSVHFDRP